MLKGAKFDEKFRVLGKGVWLRWSWKMKVWCWVMRIEEVVGV